MSTCKLKQPAAGFGGDWREGTPLGNGFHGAMMYGRIRKEKIAITHSRLWRFVTDCELPDVSDVLPKMRERIISGDALGADRMLLDALLAKGYNPGNANIMPAADINIEYPTDKVFKHYNRELDMEQGEGRVSFDLEGNSILRRVFVSRADDVVVIECERESIIDITVHEPDIPWYRAEDVLAKNPVVISEGEWTFFKCDIGGVEHGAVMRVVRGERAFIILKLYCEGTSDTMWQETKDYIEKLPADYSTLFVRHAELHSELFNRCRFELCDTQENLSKSNEELLALAYDDELPNALTQRMWDFGRYLFISGTAKGGLPCSLTGLWCPEYEAMWTINMANINIEMIYWHCMPGGLDELIHPMFNYYFNAMDELRENASKVFGCGGIYVPAVTVPGKFKHPCMAPHIINWTAGAGWLSQHYYDYYLYTQDKDFLINTALPFMRQAAEFYRDFIVRGENEWHIYPSVSPENRTLNYKNRGIVPHESTQTAIDATMDIAVIKELCSNLLRLQAETGLLSNEEAEDLEWIIANAPEYQVNESGAPREWLHSDFPDNDEHRHQSHLYPMFPGFEKTRIDEATDEIYRRGGINRMSKGVYHQTSWSLVQNANLMARVKDAELAYKSLNIIAKSAITANLFTTHNDWRGGGLTLEMRKAPFQIDGNIGWPSAVMEMLAFSYIDRLDILPARPKKWSKGSIKGLRNRVGTVADIAWDNGEYSITLTATRDTEFDLYMPECECEHVAMKKGDIISMNGKTEVGK